MCNSVIVTAMFTPVSGFMLFKATSTYEFSISFYMSMISIAMAVYCAVLISKMGTLVKLIERFEEYIENRKAIWWFWTFTRSKFNWHVLLFSNRDQMYTNVSHQICGIKRKNWTNVQMELHHFGQFRCGWNGFAAFFAIVRQLFRFGFGRRIIQSDLSLVVSGTLLKVTNEYNESILHTIFRLPFNWQAPFGYLISIVAEGGCLYTILSYCAPLVSFFFWIGLVDYLWSWWPFTRFGWIEWQRDTRPKSHESKGTPLPDHSILSGYQAVECRVEDTVVIELFEYNIDSIFLFRFVAELNDIYEFIFFAFFLYSLIGSSCMFLISLPLLVEYFEILFYQSKNIFI